MDILYETKRQLRLMIDDGQVETAVHYVLREIKEEYRDTALRYIAFTSANEDHCLFKGSRRAISHMSSENAKKEVILNLIEWFKGGYGYKHDEHHVASWLHFIEMLPEEDKTVNALYYIGFVSGGYCFREELNRLVKKALSLLTAEERQKLLSRWLEESAIILYDKHNHQTRFRVNAIDESMRDKLVSSLIKTFLRESKVKSFMYRDNKSAFDDILAVQKVDSEFVDPEMFELAVTKIEEIKLGSNMYSGQNMARILSNFMQPDQAIQFLSLAV